jgi:putative transcriptional regulator
MESINNLKHHFLLAMPQINDQYFGQSVCYIFDHSERGSIGLIINKPSDVNLADIFSELAIRSSNRNHLIKPAILQGGPVSGLQGHLAEWQA